MLTWRTTSHIRGLVFDIENKPGTFGPGDYTHPKLTAIGCLWLDRKRPKGWAFSRLDESEMRRAAEEFAVEWQRADYVIGHNARRHDVKILDGFYTMLDLPLLPRRKVIDTYLDQPKMTGLSRSLENLAYRWNCPVQKMSMPEYAWERAWDGHPDAVKLMRRRVTTDCEINAWLYRELIDRGLLRL